MTLQASESAPKQEVRWKQDFQAANPPEVAKQVRLKCNDFPDQFVKYLRERVAPNDKPS